MIAKYTPKLYHFEYDHMEASNMLACLENNTNANRKQKVSIKKSKKGGFTVKSHFRVAYRKPKKAFIARKFYNPKKYDFMKDVVLQCREKGTSGIKHRVKPQKKRMAPVERDRV